jgi:hypothetical protein
MRPLLQGGFALLMATMTAGAAGLAATGCGSSGPSGSSSGVASGSSGSASGSGASTGSSSGLSGSSSGSGASGSSASGASGGDAGACVFETLVTGLITQPPSMPVTCGSPLCGCTDNGMLITSVPGSF